VEFLKFYVLASENEQQADQDEQLVYFNRIHIVSIKPIKMLINHHVVDGYWLRLSNGKKYKATQIPDEFKKLFSETPHKRSLNVKHFPDDGALLDAPTPQ